MQTLRDFLPDGVERFLADTTVLTAASLFLLVVILAFCRVFARAGYHPALGFLMLVPGLNVALLFFLAFRRWPIETEVRDFRRMRNVVKKGDRRYGRAG
jgi:hypothetical protein